MVNFSWEESLDQNTDDEITYNIIVINQDGDVQDTVLNLDVPQESIQVPVSFIIDDPVIDEDVLFVWEVTAIDDSEGEYSTICNDSFEFILRYEELYVDEILIPEDYVLGNSYPNPFNPVTNIQYGIPEPSFITVSVYDINGRLIKVLDEGNKLAGYYTISWNANNIPSGMYFIRFSTPKYNATRKISLIK